MSSSDTTDNRINLSELDLAPAWTQGPRTGGQRPAPRERDSRHPGRPPQDRSTSAPPPQRRAPRPARSPAPRSPASHFQDRRSALEAPLPLLVQFMPARHGMEVLARRLADSRRAFPLGQLTTMFLSRLETLMIRLSTDPASGDPGASPVTLFQCRICRTVYLDRDAIVSHVLSAHLADYYRVIEETVDPPTGHFNCVTRCGLSGTLIGPPNYHGYHERLTAVHQERYAHMSFDVYRSKLETLRDAETIEAWKQSMMKRTVYQALTPPSSETLSSPAAVRRHFMDHHYADTVQSGPPCTLPGSIARTLEDARLRQTIETAWRRESHAVMRTAITVRGMLRSLGFTAFKTSDQQAFMTATAPQPLGDVEVVDSIRRILDIVREHPGYERAALINPPDGNPGGDTPETVMRHLQWLVEKGHIVLFHDGTLALPEQLHAIRSPTRSKPHKRKRPAAKKS